MACRSLYLVSFLTVKNWNDKEEKVRCVPCKHGVDVDEVEF